MGVRVLVLLSALTLPLFSEPSVFDVVDKRKQEEQKLQREVVQLSDTLKQVKESQDGMRSLFDSHMKRLQELYARDKQSPFVSKKELDDAFKDMNQTLTFSFKTYDENFDNFKTGLESLAKLVENSSEQYKQHANQLAVQLEGMREELRTLEFKIQKLVGDVEIIKQYNSAEKNGKDTEQTTKSAQTEEEKLRDSEKEVESTQQEQAKEVDITTLPNATLHTEGIALYKKGNLKEAERYLKHSAEKGYKPATSAYYLGEIAYAQKRYNDAIDYYKESATKYDKAAYIPTLLLHTASSFQKLDDKVNAKNFLDTLIQSYPDSKEAKEAKKILDNLKR